MSIKNGFRLVLLVGLFAAAAVVLTPPREARACMGDICACCNNCSGSCRCDGRSCECNASEVNLVSLPPTIVNFVSPTHVRLSVVGYKTTNLSPAISCITGFPPVEGVERVNAITNYNSATGKPFKEVHFVAADRPGEEIAALAEQDGVFEGSSAPWFGFLSKITGSVANDVPNHFVVDMTLAKGVRPDDFVRSLQAHGALATSSSTPDGVPNPGHHHFRRLSQGPVLVLFPELPEKPGRQPK